MDYAPTDDTGNHNPYRMLRNLSNSNPTLNKQPNVHVEYEMSLPIDVSAYRHPPYSSLWNLNQRCFFLAFSRTPFAHLPKLFSLFLISFSMKLVTKTAQFLTILNCTRETKLYVNYYGRQFFIFK